MLLLLEDFGDDKEDAAFLHVAELVVDRSAEHAHRGRQAHVGVDQGRDVVAELAHLAVKDLIVGLEIGAGEELRHLLGVGLSGKFGDGPHQMVAVGEMLFQEIQDHVPSRF